MINLEYITSELKNEMKMNIPDESQYYTWIDILKPINFFENTLYLEIPKSNMMFIYEKIWVSSLQEAMDKITKDKGINYKVVVVARDSYSYNKILALGKIMTMTGR